MTALSLRRRLRILRGSAIARSSVLLVVDNVGLAAMGGISTLLAARLWTPADVGLVAATVGVLNLLVIVAAIGLPTALVRYLGTSRHPRRLLFEALIVSGSLAACGLVLIVLLPGHLGVPLERLHLSLWVLIPCMTLFTLGGVVTTVGDPAWISRQQVSFMLAKDTIASVVRLALLGILAGTTATGLFLVWVIYGSSAAAIDITLLIQRVGRRERSQAPTSGSIPSPATSVSAPAKRFGALRQVLPFALGTYGAAVAATAPTYLLPTLTAALVNPRTAAYVSVALQVGYVLTIIPAQTAQALLAELARSTSDVVDTTTRAVIGAYTVTLPAAAVLVVGAPYILLLFGHQYSVHGTGFVRWLAAGSVFFVFNYVSDVVLLARHKVRAYAAINITGAGIIVVLVVGALHHGLSWLGPGWFIGQALYAAGSALVLTYYGGIAGVGRAAARVPALLARRDESS
jgi:O-antigen/teichoic acid export membrane protein